MGGLPRNNEAPPVLPPKAFLDVLRCMAIATWQEGSNRTATIRRIKGVIRDKPTSAAFDKLIDQSVNAHPTNLVTAFYYRIEETVEEVAEHEFEFTHKTFSEYLIATSIFDAFERLLDAEQNNIGDATKLAEQHEWLELVLAGPDTQEIAQFIIDEAELRYNNRAFSDWTRAFDCFRSVLCLREISSDSKFIWMTVPDNIARIRRGAIMLFLCWGALNLQRYKKENTLYELGKGNLVEGYDLKHLQAPHEPSQSADNFNSETILNGTFLANSLSGLRVQKDDLSGIQLSKGSIVGLELCETGMLQSVWNSIVLSKFSATDAQLNQSEFYACAVHDGVMKNTNCKQARFYYTKFQSVTFGDCRLDQSSFHEVQFVDCTFKATSFCRGDFINCSFNGCLLDRADFEAALFEKTVFQDCTFVDPHFDLCNLEEAEFKKCTGHKKE